MAQRGERPIARERGRDLDTGGTKLARISGWPPQQSSIVESSNYHNNSLQRKIQVDLTPLNFGAWKFCAGG